LLYSSIGYINGTVGTAEIILKFLKEVYEFLAEGDFLKVL